MTIAVFSIESEIDRQAAHIKSYTDNQTSAS